MSEIIPETLFEQIRGRASSPSDHARLHAVKLGLKLSDQDELWPIIMTFDHFCDAVKLSRNDIEGCVADIPKRVANAIGRLQMPLEAGVEEAVGRAVRDNLKKIELIAAMKIQTDRKQDTRK